MPVTTIPQPTATGHLLLDPGMDLTLRPMRYPAFFDRYRDAVKNTWTPEEVDLHSDLADLPKLSAAERHLVSRLVAFFATGDTIVSNNLVLNLYHHVNSPEGRLYLSRQLFEEANHIHFYLNLLDTYVPDEAERAEAFAAVENIPSIARKAEFCFKWIDSLFEMRELRTKEDRRAFLLNLICFAACIEGLFFYGAFAYVYFLRSRGLLNGLGRRELTLHNGRLIDGLHLHSCLIRCIKLLGQNGMRQCRYKRLAHWILKVRIILQAGDNREIT